MDPEIRETIMDTGRNVNERYGFIWDTDLVNAVDRMTFDHGKMEILIARS
jgi:hypothetical protein